MQEEANYEWCHSQTWVTWAALEAVDWQEEALPGLADVYKPGADRPYISLYLEYDDPRRRAGETGVKNGHTYRVRTATRQDLLERDWQL